MDPIGEYPLDHSHTPPVERGPRPGLLAGIAAVVVVLAGLALFYFWSGSRGAGAPDATVSPPSERPAATAGRQPLGPTVEPGPLPALDESDPLVRQLMAALSAHPEIAAWLTTDDLVRQFVRAVDNVATGTSPARHLKVLAPDTPFQAENRGDHFVVTEGTYERYDALADAVASADPAALATLYARLKPRLQEAYVELGHPAGDIDTAVEQAILQLLDTPSPQSPVVVTKGVMSFKHDLEQLESLSAAQKQLLRMGPRNARVIKRHLWALARELGIPTERLPAAEK